MYALTILEASAGFEAVAKTVATVVPGFNVTWTFGAF